MKAYGRKRQDYGCCPGHDKYPPDKYNSARSRRARSKRNKEMHQVARAMLKAELLYEG